MNNTTSWFFAGLMLASWSSKGKPFTSSGFRKRWAQRPHACTFPLKGQNEQHNVSSILMMNCVVMYWSRHHHADLLEPLTFVEFWKKKRDHDFDVDAEVTVCVRDCFWPTRVLYILYSPSFSSFFPFFICVMVTAAIGNCTVSLCNPVHHHTHTLYVCRCFRSP